MTLKERICSLFMKYREFILYVFFGIFTTAANLAVYFICAKLFHINVLASNAIAWVAGVIVAFVTNKLYVFQSRGRDVRTVVREVLEFTGARALTGIFEEVFLYVTVERMSLWDVPMKLITNAIVILFNYIFSKLIIFRKKPEETSEEAPVPEEAESTQ